jgi:hypothetical protein
MPATDRPPGRSGWPGLVYSNAHRTGPAGRRGKGATPWPTSACCCGDRIETASMVTASGPLFAMLGITLNAPDCWGT